MNAVVHVIAAIGVNHVDVIGVTPSDWPGIYETEGVSTVLEAAIIVVATVYMETVTAAKAGGVMRVRNAAMRVTAVVAAGRLLGAGLGLSLCLRMRRGSTLLLRARGLLGVLLSWPGVLGLLALDRLGLLMLLLLLRLSALRLLI